MMMRYTCFAASILFICLSNPSAPQGQTIEAHLTTASFSVSLESPAARDANVDHPPKMLLKVCNKATGYVLYSGPVECAGPDELIVEGMVRQAYEFKQDGLRYLLVPLLSDHAWRTWVKCLGFGLDNGKEKIVVERELTVCYWTVVVHGELVALCNGWIPSEDGNHWKLTGYVLNLRTGNVLSQNEVLHDDGGKEIRKWDDETGTPKYAEFQKRLASALNRALREACK